MTVGVLVWALILWAVIAYRKRSDALPEQVKYNMPIEILYTVAPLIIVAGLGVGANLDLLETMFHDYSLVVWSLLGLAAAVAVGRWAWRRRKARA